MTSFERRRENEAYKRRREGQQKKRPKKDGEAENRRTRSKFVASTNVSFSAWKFNLVRGRERERGGGREQLVH